MNRLLALQLGFACCAIVLLAMTIPGFWLHHRFLRGLRTRHPQLWQRFGRPTVVCPRSRRARRELIRWVESGGFQDLADPAFAADCRRYRAYGRAYGVAFAGLWLLFALIVVLRLTTA